MLQTPPPGARRSPSTARNRVPICEALREILPKRGRVLELAAGTGEHAVSNAAAFPALEWTPTDVDEAALESISAWRAYAGPPNLNAPLRLDASAPETWPVTAADAVICINMIHIAPIEAAKGLLRGAGRILPEAGALIVYGPFFEPDLEPAPSNVAFDRELRARDPAWGLRNLEEISAWASDEGLPLDKRLQMPANNLLLVFRKRPAPP